MDEEEYQRRLKLAERVYKAAEGSCAPFAGHPKTRAVMAMLVNYATYEICMVDHEILTRHARCLVIQAMRNVFPGAPLPTR